MTTIRFWLPLLATACKPTPAAEPQPVIENVAASDPTSPARDTVRPPVAEDLATYTKDLPGAGGLEAVIETPLGSLRCDLFADKAPLTVANFVGLATGKKAWLHPATKEVVRDKPFYDGLIFHRVIPGFMIQGGDPEGTGAGGPGYSFDDEIAGLTMDPGTLAMANAGPKTNGSQFFVMEGSRPDLASRHTIFGKCDEIDVVTKIANAPAENDRPETPVTMRVRIARAGMP